MSKIGWFFLVLVVLWPISPSFAKERAKGDGRLSLYNYHENEYAEVSYRHDGKYDQSGLKIINRIMRSRDGKERPIDLRLIELVDLVQDHFNAEMVEIISGYKSPNKSRAATHDPSHIHGRAVDIHLDEVSEEKIFDYLVKLGRGGVGLYPNDAFVHVDVEKGGSWREEPSGERVVYGTESNPNLAWSALTDKSQYAPDERISVTITNSGYKKQKPATNFWVEGFRRGEWAGHEKISVEGKTASLKPGSSKEFVWTIPTHQKYGRYRFVIFVSRDFSVPPVYSNEFYVRQN